VALFLKGLARRISFHFNSVPVRQRACQAWSPAERSARRRSTVLGSRSHSTAGRESVFHAVSLCVRLCVCAYRRPSCLFVIRIVNDSIAHMHPMLAGSLHVASAIGVLRPVLPPSAPHFCAHLDLRNANGLQWPGAVKCRSLCEIHASRTSDSWPSGSRPITKRRSRHSSSADRHVASRGPVGRRCPPSTV